MKTPKRPLFLTLAFTLVTSLVLAQNICLDFDGRRDEVMTALPLANEDFTIEMWYLSTDNSTDQNCRTNHQTLFALNGSNTTWLAVNLCGGQLSMDWLDLAGNPVKFDLLDPTNFNTGTWHHLAVTRVNKDVFVYIDCVLVWQEPIVDRFDWDRFNVGRWRTGDRPPVTREWWGRVDDVRVWGFGKTQQQIDDEKHCVVKPRGKMLLYWTFDEGTANGNNTSIGTITDQTGNAYNGTLNDFALVPVFPATPGTMSNFVNSTAPIAYPNLNQLELEIRDYPYQNNLLTEICTGDPAHFRLSLNGNVPGPYANIPVQWFYRDGSGTPVALPSPPFSDFSFGVPQGNINYDCTTSTQGFVDRTFYAVASVKEPVSGKVCDYVSDEYDLRICCPISPATVSISPTGLMCEGESLAVTVCLNSPDPFVQNPGPNVDIEWYFDGTYIGFTDQTCINYTVNAPLVTVPTNLCFEARVTNCNGKAGNFEACISVDPEPVCGSIIGWPQPTPQNLNLVSSIPLIYEICPGNDAILHVDPADPFQDCNPQWEYSFDQITWVPLGFTNTQQNTNILPTSLWPGNQIFYRVECQPLSDPSGCDPCYSNIIEIRLPAPPAPGTITGRNQLCKRDTSTLKVQNPVPGEMYTWYCDGVQVGTGPSYFSTHMASACYWVETRDVDNCYLLTSAQYCVDVCEVVPVLSCPLPPNDCACLGDPITLSACDSYSTCPGANLSYQWFIDGILQATTTCTITHTPPASGSTYKVVVTDQTTGCSAETERRIIPCDKD